MAGGMIRREITAAASLALALAALLADDRRAQGAGFDVESFKPAATRTGYLCEESARTLPAGALEARLAFGYTHRPLVLRSQVDGGVAGDIVARRSTGYVGASYGVTDRIDVGFRLPVVLAQFGDVAVDWTNSGAVPQRPAVRALGDLDVMARVRLAGMTDRPGMRLTLSAPLGLPIGDTDALVGTGGVSFRPRLIAGWESPRLSVGVSAGYEFRRRTQVPGSTFVVGQAIGAGAGVAFLAVPQPVGFIEAVAVLAEVSASVGLEQPESGLPAFPAQALVGMRAGLPQRFVVQLGVGSGLNQAAGSPRFRALATLAWTWEKLREAPAPQPPAPPKTEPALAAPVPPAPAAPVPPSTVPVPPATAPAPPPEAPKRRPRDASPKKPNRPPR